MASSGDEGEVLNARKRNVPFDTVCAICDNGGVLICCEGKCYRSFHANVEFEGAEESKCETLGLPSSPYYVQQVFRCNNCLYGQHQCFVCGQLGSSDESLGAEVFCCSYRTCGHFYHPRCVAKVVHPYIEANQNYLQENIGAGGPFICPAHKCRVCNQTEAENVKDFQFAICRRCPTSYHRRCLPREIMFDYQDDDDDIPRAYDGLLPKNRALIYCLKHEIDEDLGTPARISKFD